MPASRPEKGWLVSRSWAIAPPTGEGYDAAYIVRLTNDDGLTHDVTVEFEAPSALTSVGYAEEIARKYLRAGEPPRHVIVDTQRAVRVANETPGG